MWQILRELFKRPPDQKLRSFPQLRQFNFLRFKKQTKQAGANLSQAQTNLRKLELFFIRHRLLLEHYILV